MARGEPSTSPPSARPSAAGARGARTLNAASTFARATRRPRTVVAAPGRRVHSPAPASSDRRSPAAGRAGADVTRTAGGGDEDGGESGGDDASARAVAGGGGEAGGGDEGSAGADGGSGALPAPPSCAKNR
jgi:hypothetical protein